MAVGFLTNPNKIKILIPVCLLCIGLNYLVFHKASFQFIRDFRHFSDPFIGNKTLSRCCNCSLPTHSKYNSGCQADQNKLKPQTPTGKQDVNEQGTFISNNQTVFVEKKTERTKINSQNNGNGNSVTIDTEEAKQEPEVAGTTSKSSQTKLPGCLETPPNLKGLFAASQKKRTPEELQQLYPDIEPGGRFKPKDCIAIEKLAIVIPYRNRYSHLHILLYNLLPMLMRQQLDFTIFVIEQDMPTTFNRGMLFNVGYLEALKINEFDCFIFHDVDMIPLNDKCLYRCSSDPRHMTAAVNKWRYGLPYNGYFGGVVAFTKEQFKKINGDSNLYFGWGGEDDDLRARVVNNGYKTLRYPKEIGRYDMISHKRDSGNSVNPDRNKLIQSARNRQHKEGLNTTKYKVTKIDFKPLYTWINVFLNMSEVLETAPLNTVNDIQVLLKQSKEFDKV